MCVVWLLKNICRHCFSGRQLDTLSNIGGKLSKCYLEPWSTCYHERFDDMRLKVCAHAILAPNGHNMQPWIIRLDPKDNLRFKLFVDPSRLTREIDPFVRQTVVSCGTFLGYAEVTAQKMGCQLNMEIFPEGNFDSQGTTASLESKSVAAITIGMPKGFDDRSYASIFMAGTNRFPYLPDKIGHDVCSQLSDMCNASGLRMQIYQDDANLIRIGNYVMEAANIEARIKDVAQANRKLFRANERQKNKFRYGFSFESQGVSGVKMMVAQVMLTVIPSMNSEKATSGSFLKSTREAVAGTPAFGIMLSKDNSREMQLKSGICYAKLVLAANTEGLCVQPLSQALQEYGLMEEIKSNIHADYARNGEAVQMLFRIGKPSRQAQRTMRRDLMEMVF